MLIVLGYSFNQRDGRLEQGGLLQFGSIPSGANVTLDELVLGSRTATKATVESGSHSVDFDLTGYRTWKKTIAIEPGQIGWVNYARLVPTTLNPETVRTFPSVVSSVASPRQNWILVLESADQPTFELADIQSDVVRYTTIVLPQSVYTQPDAGKASSFAIDSWSQDENAVLIKHSFNDDQTEWIYLNRDEPSRSVNVNAAFGIAPSRLVFGGGGHRLLFVQTDDVVRRINLDEQTLSRPLVSKLIQFETYDEKTIIYTAVDAEGKRVVGYAATDIAQPVVLGTYPADDKPLFASMRTYFYKRYVSILHGEQIVISNGELPTLTNKGNLKEYAKVTVPQGVAELVTSRNGRFTIARTADGFVTYDLELKKYDKTKWAQQSQNQRPIQWLDDYMLWSDNGGDVRIYDFDGANQQSIMKVNEGSAVTMSDNNKYLYGFTQNAKGVGLTRVKMIIN